jgi:hypothetical protein
LENTGECWHKQDIGDQTEDIRAEVLYEIDWSCNEWDHVYHKHNDSAAGDDVDFSSPKVVFWISNSDPSVTFLFLAGSVLSNIISIM